MKKVLALAVVLSFVVISAAPKPAVAGLEALLPILVPPIAAAVMALTGVPSATAPDMGPVRADRVQFCAPMPECLGPAFGLKTPADLGAATPEQIFAPESPAPVRPAPEQLFEN